jgi:signal transduction histidine kinase
MSAMMYLLLSKCLDAVGSITNEKAPSMGRHMTTDIGKILTLRNRHYILVPVALLNILPPLLTGLFNPGALMEVLLFTAAACAGAFLHSYWLSKQDAQWAKVLTLLIACGLTGWYTLSFLNDFSNAYLSAVILVQLIFLLLGARYGVIVLGLVTISDLIYLILNPGTNILASIFALTVQATVGLLSWVFVSAANDMRRQAESSAAVAHAAMGEAQRLAAEVTKLNHILLSSQDRERQRLARDIHDGPLQSMGVELLALDRARRRLEAGEYNKASSELEYLRGLVRETVNDLRDTVNMLRNSLLDSGIEPALQNLARKTHVATGLDVEIVLHPDRERVLELPYAISSCIYQLAVEGLNNIKKHARATNATITIETKDDQVILSIKDDGRGFDYEAAIEQALNRGHIGLYSMKERAYEFGGEMLITSTPGGGTNLVFIFPTALDAPQTSKLWLSGPL